MKSVIGDFVDEDSRNLPFRPLANQKKVVLKQLVSDTVRTDAPRANIKINKHYSDPRIMQSYSAVLFNLTKGEEEKCRVLTHGG